MSEPRFESHVGIWTTAFSLVAIVAVVTNLASMYVTKILFPDGTRLAPASVLLASASNLTQVLILVGVEHGFGLVALIVSGVLSGTQRALSNDIYRQEYYSKSIAEEQTKQQARRSAYKTHRHGGGGGGGGLSSPSSPSSTTHLGTTTSMGGPKVLLPPLEATAAATRGLTPVEEGTRSAEGEEVKGEGEQA